MEIPFSHLFKDLIEKEYRKKIQKRREYYEKNKDKIRVYQWAFKFFEKYKPIIWIYHLPTRLSNENCLVCGEPSESYLFSNCIMKLREGEFIDVDILVFRHANKKPPNRYHFKILKPFISIIDDAMYHLNEAINKLKEKVKDYGYG